ncbi:hypothetical protein RBB50_004937 [Rhinocladiella similis]
MSTATALKKHRAPKACERCRVRKVRCDIVLRKGKCTNCSLDDLDCIEPGPRRQRGTARRQPRIEHTEPDSADTVLIEDSVHSRALPDDSISFQVSMTTAEVNDYLIDPTTSEPEPPSGSINHEEMQVVPDSNEDLFPDFTGDLLQRQSLENLSSLQGPTGTPPDDDRVPFPDLQKLLPAFIAPIHSQRTYMYCDFLASRKAFDIPTPPLLRAILKRYTEFVHPHIPLVDIHHVLEAVSTEGRCGRISLLLLQAMLLAGSSYVDMEYVSGAGFCNRMALRSELAERVRLLYDFDCETDRLILVQCLVLMTSWQDKGDEVKHLRHWISIAYNISLLLGLNREPPASFNAPVRYKSLRKRIWWALYLRDRMLSLGLRQSPIIAAEVCEILEPEMEDFDIHPAPPEVCAMLGDCTLLRDLDQQSRLVDVFKSQLQLSHHIHEIFKSRYTVVAPKIGSTHMIALVLVPKQLSLCMPAVQVCSSALDKSFKRLPENLRYRPPFALHFDPGEEVLVLHCGMLNLMYYALVCALHRSHPSLHADDLPSAERTSQRKARHASNAIFSILEELHALDTVSFMPTQALTFILQGTVTTLADMTSKDYQARKLCYRRLQISMDIINSLKDVHSYSFYAINFLAAVAAKLSRQSQQGRDHRSAIPRPRQSNYSSEFGQPSLSAPVPSAPSTSEMPPSSWMAMTDVTAIAPLEHGSDHDLAWPNLSGLPEWLESGFDGGPFDLTTGWEFFLDP